MVMQSEEVFAYPSHLRREEAGARGMLATNHIFLDFQDTQFITLKSLCHAKIRAEHIAAIKTAATRFNQGSSATHEREAVSTQYP